jgi:hypothetical protein
MPQDERSKASAKTEPIKYETPRIEDYGTLTELTASKGPRQADFLGGADNRGGGGYS